MSDRGLVSIIIPTFNDVAWVGAAVDSALAQSYPSSEIIVVDDGSTDGTGALIRNRYGRRVRYVYQPNRGLPAARNAGLALAKGEYVQFLDADDILLPSKLADHVDVLEKDPECSVVYSDFAFIDGSEGRMPSGFGRRYRSGNVFSNLLDDNFIVVHAALSRCADIVAVGGFDENLLACEDYDLWLRLAAEGRRFAHTADVLVLYRQRPGGMSRNLRRQIDSTLAVIEKVPTYVVLDEQNRERWRRRLVSLRDMMVRSLVADGLTSLRRGRFITAAARLADAVRYDLAGVPSRVIQLGGHIRDRIQARRHPLEAKRQGELRYWQDRAAMEGALGRNHFEWYFTDHFGIDASEYRGKRVLDVGCGPRGSLEWATSAATRIGVDPLAHPYLALGAAGHSMTYISASADALPFQSNVFDVVSSFNSLDHVDDLAATIHELQRVLRPGGRLLLLAEVNQPATIVEPITLFWDTPDLFDALEVIRVEHYEVMETGLFDSLRIGRKYDHSNSTSRTGVISAHFTKPR